MTCARFGCIAMRMKVPLTIRLPSELMQQARRMAVVERRTLTSVIEEALRAVTEEEQPAPAARK